MSARRSKPKQFSAYLIAWSDQPAMPVGAVVVDKGARLERDWEFINFETDVLTCAGGRRIARLCPDCRHDHEMVGMLGHDGDCGSEEVRTEAQQELAHAKKQLGGGER